MFNPIQKSNMNSIKITNHYKRHQLIITLQKTITDDVKFNSSK